MRGHPNTTGPNPSSTDTERQLETVRYHLIGNRSLHTTPDYLYHADQYARDVREWVAATEVEPKRHGQMLIFALGGAARRIFDDLEIEERQYGVDLPDGNGGHFHITAVEFILRVLEDRFPVHQ